MKYNFDKLLDIPKYQSGTTGEGIKPLINLTNKTRTNRYTNQFGWAGADKQWLTADGQYDFEKMYQDYLKNKGSFNLTGITATPDWENATADKKQYLDWNRQYNASGLNKYFGYSDQQADYYGPTTSARKAFLDYIKQREQLYPNELPEITVEPNKSDIVKDVTETDNNLNVQPKYPIPGALKKQSPWTDWLPLTAQLSNDLISAQRQASLQKLKSFPLQEFSPKFHKVQNDYHLRTGMEQNASDLMGLSYLRSNSSDMTQNMDNIRKYDTEATGIRNQAEQKKADTTFREEQISEEMANQNKEGQTAIGNNNRMVLSSAWNNILDANLRQELANTAALNSYIGNMYTSHGEWLKDRRLNDLQYAQGTNEYLASVDAQKAYDEFNKLNEFNSKAYTDFKNWFNTDQARDIEGFNAGAWEAAKAHGTTEDYIKNLWRTSKDALTYRDAWTKEQQDAEQKLINQLQMIRMHRNVAGLYLPATVTNQGLYRKGQFAPTYQSIFSHKRGGSVRARAIDYWEHIRKESQSTKKAQEKRNSDVNKKLQQDLDRLTKEQLILLRAIFK